MPLADAAGVVAGIVDEAGERAEMWRRAKAVDAGGLVALLVGEEDDDVGATGGLRMAEGRPAENTSNRAAARKTTGRAARRDGGRHRTEAFTAGGNRARREGMLAGC